MTKKMKNKKRKERRRKKRLIEMAIEAASGHIVTLHKDKIFRGLDPRFSPDTPIEHVRTFQEQKYIRPNYKILNALIEAQILGKPSNFLEKHTSKPNIHQSLPKYRPT